MKERVEGILWGGIGHRERYAGVSCPYGRADFSYIDGGGPPLVIQGDSNH